MRNFGFVGSSLWRSDRFSSCSDGAKMLYLWMLTSGQDMIGDVFVFHPTAVPETACSARSLNRRLSELVAVGLIERDAPHNLVRITQFLRWVPIRSWQHAVMVIRGTILHRNSVFAAHLCSEVQLSDGFLSLKEREGVRNRRLVEAFYDVFQSVSVDAPSDGP